jgi:hypothetical protein
MIQEQAYVTVHDYKVAVLFNNNGNPEAGCQFQPLRRDIRVQKNNNFGRLLIQEVGFKVYPSPLCFGTSIRGFRSQRLPAFDTLTSRRFV